MSVDPPVPAAPARPVGAMSVNVWSFGATSGMTASSLDDLAAHLDDPSRVG